MLEQLGRPLAQHSAGGSTLWAYSPLTSAEGSATELVGRAISSHNIIIVNRMHPPQVWTTIEKHGKKWLFGWPPAPGCRPNGHFVPHFLCVTQGNQRMRNSSKDQLWRHANNHNAPGALAVIGYMFILQVFRWRHVFESSLRFLQGAEVFPFSSVSLLWFIHWLI